MITFVSPPDSTGRQWKLPVNDWYAAEIRDKLIQGGWIEMVETQGQDE